MNDFEFEKEFKVTQVIEVVVFGYNEDQAKNRAANSTSVWEDWFLVEQTKVEIQKKLRKGTYIREPDGAMHLYYCNWYYNDASVAFRDRSKSPSTAKEWQIVNNEQECEELVEYMQGHLEPGEFVEVRDK